MSSCKATNAKTAWRTKGAIHEESGAKSLMANSVMEAQDCPSLGAIRVRYSIPLLPGVNTPQLRSLVGLDRVVLTEDQAMTILRSAVAAGHLRRLERGRYGAPEAK